jgi:hypothetical protein
MCIGDSLFTGDSYVYQIGGLLLLLLLLFTAIELSLSGSSPYTSTDKTNKRDISQQR